MEIKFKRDTSFRKQFFVPESFAHPAKMDAQLLIWIVEHYSEAGETILDPMAGMGTTMLACILGRDVVLVELEEKFCKMMRDNWEQVKMRPQLGSTMGNCQIIQGDARQLEGLVDKIVTSPPYANIGVGQEASKNLIEERIRKGIAGATITEDGRYMTGNGKYLKEYSPSKDNIGNLPYGEIDKCIFSPPYAEGKTFHDLEFMDKTSDDQRRRTESGEIKGHSFTTEARQRVFEKAKQGKIENPDNLGNLPYGQIDKIVTSPPYEGTLDGTGEGPLVTSKKNPSYKPMPSGYSVDSIITSPPYQAFGASREGEKIRTGQSEIHQTKSLPTTYTNKQTENIGNKQGQSYLEAMLQVYRQCWKVLKPEGLMILVTKNFIRNKQVVRLDEDTIKLCEQAGFNFIERHYRKLPSQSFWRVIYHNKFPDVEQILNEDILVFKK